MNCDLEHAEIAEIFPPPRPAPWPAFKISRAASLEILQTASSKANCDLDSEATCQHYEVPQYLLAGRHMFIMCIYIQLVD